MIAWAGVRTLAGQAARFGAVGGVGFVVDVAVFNALLAAGTAGHLRGAAVVAKASSTVVAIAVNWLGNRYWAFREHRRDDVLREAVEFGVVSLAGSVVTLACLGVSHYVLHLTSPLADNISANIVGLALGSVVRFVAYRGWVFAAGPAPLP
ncbi:MAG: GtrA family protein [Pseudolysinimonas sp.]